LGASVLMVLSLRIAKNRVELSQYWYT
jgi:hypothetical protein